MLTFSGGRIRLCDRLPRRSFLSIGSLAVGGLTLPHLLRAEDHAGIRSSHKAIIMFYLTGGPPHQDMVDLKPHAPSEIRGEFRPVSTNVPGIQICQLMPRVASMMDKFAMLAGGGMKTGQVIGETNRLAEEPVSRPVHYNDVTATLYHRLGINTANTTIPDLTGRPQYVSQTHEPIRELV